MKKLIKIIGFGLAITIVLFIIWRNLPLSVTRYSDIKLGNEIVNQIENYERNNSLPENGDWKTLKNFSFRDKKDYYEPEYNKLHNNTFELIYVEGFDGPYLMWNSEEKIWKMGNPTFSRN